MSETVVVRPCLDCGPGEMWELVEDEPYVCPGCGRTVVVVDIERLRAADSDGAAQALARVVDEVSRRNGAGNIDIARALSEWRRLQAREAAG